MRPAAARNSRRDAGTSRLFRSRSACAELIALISGASLFVGNDSGPVAPGSRRANARAW